MLSPRRIKPPVLLAGLVTVVAASQPVSSAEVYEQQIAPFMRQYCVQCHNDKKANGNLNLARYTSAAQMTRDFRHWQNIAEFIRDGEMPPEKSPQPDIERREDVVKTIEELLLVEATKRAGDPGVVLPRRLSNAEYDLSVRDLTGVDIRPTHDFPADPAAGEGFDNTGEALTMSPSLLKKYLSAAGRVGSHLVLKTDGIAFAPFPVTSYNERKKLTEQAIIDFYRENDVRLIDYLTAAWRYAHRGSADRNVDIGDWAARHGLSGKYLTIVRETLEAARDADGLLKQVGHRWRTLPAPQNETDVPREIGELAAFIGFCQSQLFDLNDRLIRPNAGTWPIGQLDVRAEKAAKRDRFDPGVLSRRYGAGSNRNGPPFVRFDKLPAATKGQPANGGTLTLHVAPAFASARGNYLVVTRPAFSKNGNLPRQWEHPASLTKESDIKRFDEEVAKNDVISLRSFLEQHAPKVARRLNFGRHPKGHAIHADSLAIEAPARVEIPLTAELVQQLRDRQLAMPCELDPEHGRDGAVYVWQTTNKTTSDRSADNPSADDLSADDRPAASGAADFQPPTGSVLLIDPDGDLAKTLAASHERFCATFPNRFFYIHDSRGLAAGFHLVEGFFRDDLPLVNKVLSDGQQGELDQLWEELHFVTNSVETLIRGFVWFERSERHVLHDERFDFLRAEDPELVKAAMLNRFERVYLDRMNVKLAKTPDDQFKPERDDPRFDMIHGFFESIRNGLAHRRELLGAAEQRALRDLEEFARRAFRRELSPAESESLHGLYARLRGQSQSIEESLRGVLTAILMSPDFCYRYSASRPGADVHLLDDYALASRLSYFLWSSIPDEELLQAAKAGRLQGEAALRQQVRRMLRDSRVNALAREFLGQWLRYRDYLSNDPINAGTFAGYDEPLRQAMFEEPVRLATYLIQNDLPITELLTTDATFVNRVLANHYGAPISSQYSAAFAQRRANQGRATQQASGKSADNADDVWLRVDGLRASGRGGLFGMGVILTANSAGERTSPVKRGFWTVHHLLGKHFPPPPADVPELPASETAAKKTIRELLAEHASNAKCAICHTHFDSLGLAMEGFDPIGRARTKDLAGRPIDSVAELPNGQTAQGIPGLIEYIDGHRREDFVRTICRKFLGYALGRSVMLSDQPLLYEMERKLKENDYRFSVMFETVVLSPQFRKQRGGDSL